MPYRSRSEYSGMKWDVENLAWYKDEDRNPEPRKLVKPFLAYGNVYDNDEPLSEVELAARRYADDQTQAKD